MTVQVRSGGRSLAVDIAPHLDRWVESQPYTGHLHSGDLGWHLRFGDDEIDGTLRAWLVDDEPVAAGLVDAGVLRLAVAPGWSRSELLAVAVGTEGAGLEYVDAGSGTALRELLLSQGWSADPDPWVVLYKGAGLP